jgi:hypothetical protein
MKKRVRGREIYMSELTYKHLYMSAAHFECSVGAFLDVLFDALQIAKLPSSDNPKTLDSLEHFKKYLSTVDFSKQNYLFKDL